jgi:hypothetical protein
MNKPEATTDSQKEKDMAPDDTSSALHDAEITAAQASVKQSFLLLRTGTAKKLGKQSEGGISYRILSDADRKSLCLSITGNDSGGYFSREIVPFSKVEACVAKHEQEKSFPSRVFKVGVFTGRSSNDPGFLCAIMRAEKLLAAAPDVESQHVVAGDWTAWKKSLLSETGTPIEADGARQAEKQVEAESVPDHT